MKTAQHLLISHQSELSQCHLCKDMQGPPVFGEACASKVMLIGQAPGFKEIEVHRPFAGTAGKTLFNWFKRIDTDEDGFRQHIYMSAICRCFPGKKIVKGIRQKTGDRVPSTTEIQNCSQWLKGTSKNRLCPLCDLKHVAARHGPQQNGCSILKGHNAADACFRSRPHINKEGLNTLSRLCVTFSHQAISMLSKTSLDSEQCVKPECTSYY